MQSDVIITDEFVWLQVSNTISPFDKMLGVPKRIIYRMSVKASLSSTVTPDPICQHLPRWLQRCKIFKQKKNKKQLSEEKMFFFTIFLKSFML